MLAQSLDNSCDARRLLADGHVYAVDGLAFLEVLALVDDCVDCDGGLADLAVADDELALAAAYGHHRVDGLDTGLKRLFDGLAVDDTRSLALQRHAEQLALDGATSVDGLAENVDDTAEHTLSHGDRGDFAGALDAHALGDSVDVVEEDYADVALLEVERHAGDAVFKFHKLVGTDIVEAIDMGNAVADFKNSAGFFERHLGVDIVELLFQYFRNLAGINHEWKRGEGIWVCGEIGGLTFNE